MFLISVEGVCGKILRRGILTSGARNIHLCQFDFCDQWEGLDKTAVFQAQDVKISVVLDGENRCQIPHEVLNKPYVKLFAGVYGTKNGELVMPTVLLDLGRVEKGVSPGETGTEPTPDVYDQILASANQASQLARQLQEDADAGRFDGQTPEIGANGNWFIGGEDTGKPASFGEGGNGATFTPAVDQAGNLSWSNDKGLANPVTVNIKGPKGDAGTAGSTPIIGVNGNWFIDGVDTGRPSQGAPGSGSGGSGDNGATFTPYLDGAGNLSWSNDRGLANPATVNIKGPQGIQGEQGLTGPKGDKGEPGVQGEKGESGSAGRTPVKGTDYWTQEDQAQMVQQVLAALPDGDEVSY